jgi:hypothetical protein
MLFFSSNKSYGTGMENDYYNNDAYAEDFQLRLHGMSKDAWKEFS